PVLPRREGPWPDAGDDDRAVGDAPTMLHRLWAARIDHRRVAGEHHARPEDRCAPDVHALHHDAPGPDEGAVLDHDRRRLQRLEDPADPDPSGEVDVRADLRAG